MNRSSHHRCKAMCILSRIGITSLTHQQYFFYYHTMLFVTKSIKNTTPGHVLRYMQAVLYLIHHKLDELWVGGVLVVFAVFVEHSYVDETAADHGRTTAVSG